MPNLSYAAIASVILIVLSLVSAMVLTAPTIPIILALSAIANAVLSLRDRM